MNLYTIFGSAEHKLVGKRMEQGAVVTLFGSATVDLSGAELAQDKVILNVICVFGETVVTIPPHWDTEYAVVNAFAGSEGATETRAAAGPCLRIQGLVLMASLKIRTRDPSEPEAADDAE